MADDARAHPMHRHLLVALVLLSTAAAFVWVGGMAYALFKSAIFVMMNAFGG